jgi:hypothetical protein
MTTYGVYHCSDPNVVLISVLPFLFPNNSETFQVAYRIVKDSKYGKSLDFIPKTAKNPSLYVKLLSTLSDKFLWVFVGLVMESQVVNHQKGKAQEDLDRCVRQLCQGRRKAAEGTVDARIP